MRKLNLALVFLPFFVRLSVTFNLLVIDNFKKCVISMTAKTLDFNHEKNLAGNLKLAECEGFLENPNSE